MGMEAMPVYCAAYQSSKGQSSLICSRLLYLSATSSTAFKIIAVVKNLDLFQAFARWSTTITPNDTGTTAN